MISPRLQRALLLFFKPEYYIEVRKGPEAAGRAGLNRRGRRWGERPEDAGRLARSEYVPTIRTQGEA